MIRRPIGFLPLLYLVIGVIVAASHQFFANLGTLGGWISAILAVLLWPLILLGVKIAIVI